MCISAANYIINTINEKNELENWNVKLSSKRLQKLLYFSDVLYMLKNEGKSMFKDDFYAWPSGPVIPRIYEIFVRYQEGYMRPFEEELHNNLTESMRKCIDSILECTRNITRANLVTVSHVQDGPWENVVNYSRENYNKVIPKSSIYNFYKDKNNIPDFMKEVA